MSNNGAILVMPNGADRDSKTPLLAQTDNIGSDLYIENDFSHRDATFEEIFHLVHSYGIGTIQEFNQLKKCKKFWKFRIFFKNK